MCGAGVRPCPLTRLTGGAVCRLDAPRLWLVGPPGAGELRGEGGGGWAVVASGTVMAQHGGGALRAEEAAGRKGGDEVAARCPSPLAVTSKLGTRLC